MILASRFDSPVLSSDAMSRPGEDDRLWAACHSPRLADDRRAPEVVEQARALLVAGADPNAWAPSDEVSNGRMTALMGAAGRYRNVELTRLLLEHGADPSDRSTLWDSTALYMLAGTDDVDCLRLILAKEPHPALVGTCLTRKLEREHPAGTALLLEHMADPGRPGPWGSLGSQLHHAIAHGRSLEIVELLLDAGAPVDARDRDGRSTLAAALRWGRDDVAGRLRERGAGEEDLEPVDLALSAAMRGDGPVLRELMASDPRLPLGLRRIDHQLVVAALRHGRRKVVPLLLELGCDPRVPADDGETALHLASEAADATTMRALLAAGASPAARDHRARTALDRVHARPQDGAAAVAARLLAEHGASRSVEVAHEVFERAADAVAGGDAGGLRELLRAHPGLVHARSRRPHHATLLHYVAANGVEDARQRTPPNAPDIARVLLDAGAEPDALADFYGGGPAQTTLSLMVSSGHPDQAGVSAELVRALCEGGARPDGIDADGIPMATAVAFGMQRALDALVAVGAPVDNVVFAAACGRLDHVRACVDVSSGAPRLRPDAVHCRVPWLSMPRDPVLAVQSAFVRAASFGRLEVVRWLLERGIDVDARPVAERTALHEACLHGRVDVARALLDAGADATIRERQWHGTPLDWAEHGGSEALLALLAERGLR